MKQILTIVAVWLLMCASTFYAGWNFATPEPEVDRGSWLIIHCEAPVLVLFEHNDGSLESFKIYKIEELAPLKNRAMKAPHKYVVNIQRNCGITAQTLEETK